MMVADLARALTVGLVPLAAALGVLSLPVLLVAASLTGFFSVFFQTAYAPYLRQLLPTEQLNAGNAYLQSGRSAARIVGPSLGGALIAIVGASTTLIVDAASFLVSCAALATITTPFHAAASTAERRPIRTEIAEGLRVLRESRLLGAITAAMGTANLFLSAMGAIEIVFLVRAVHASSSMIGTLMTIGGVGGLAGALLSRRLNDQYGTGRVGAYAFLATAPAALLLPATHHGITVILFAVGLCAISFGISLGGVALITLRLQHCPQPLQGRVGACSRVLNAAAIPLGALLGGTAGQYLGTRTTLVALAVGYLAFSVALVRSPVSTAVPVAATTQAA